MSNLRQAAQQALEALEQFSEISDFTPASAVHAITALRAALAEPERKPLTDEEIELAYRRIWRDLPSDFDHTTASWIEQGIRYAEIAHGITNQETN